VYGPEVRLELTGIAGVGIVPCEVVLLDMLVDRN